MLTNSPIWKKPAEWLKIYIFISEVGIRPYKEIQESCNVSKATVDHFMRWHKEQEATPKATTKAIKSRLTNQKEVGIEATTKAIVKATEKEILPNSFEEAEKCFERIKEAKDNGEQIEKELINFFDYWTAPMKSGKELWRSNKTFAFKLRLSTWLKRSGKVSNFSFSQQSKGTAKM